MPRKNQAKLAALKKALVQKQGCKECGAGQVPEDFTQYWDAPESYKAGSYTIDGDLMSGKLCLAHCRRCRAHLLFRS